jgi:hypothetical protein
MGVINKRIKKNKAIKKYKFTPEIRHAAKMLFSLKHFFLKNFRKKKHFSYRKNI